MATPVKHPTADAPSYGSQRVYLEEVVVAQGGANPLVVKATSDASNPPCAAEIVSITRTGTGVNVVVLADAYYARAYATADVDDTANDGSYATIGNWTNLQTSVPAQFTLYTRNAAGALADLASGRAVSISVGFKRCFTGASA